MAPSPTARAGEPTPQSNFFNVTPGHPAVTSKRTPSIKKTSTGGETRSVVMAREKSLKGIRERQKRDKPRKKLGVIEVPEKWKEITNAETR